MENVFPIKILYIFAIAFITKGKKFEKMIQLFKNNIIRNTSFLQNSEVSGVKLKKCLKISGKIILLGSLFLYFLHSQ